MSIRYIYFNSHNKEVPYCYLSPYYYAKFKINDVEYINVMNYVNSVVDGKDDINTRIYDAYRTLFAQNDDLLTMFLSISNSKSRDSIRFVYATADNNVLGIGYNACDAPAHKPRWGKNTIGHVLTKLYSDIKPHYSS